MKLANHDMHRSQACGVLRMETSPSRLGDVGRYAAAHQETIDQMIPQDNGLQKNTGSDQELFRQVLRAIQRINVESCDELGWLDNNSRTITASGKRHPEDLRSLVSIHGLPR